MGYTELKDLKGMQNRKDKYDGKGLADQALLFIRDSCEGLRFDPEKADETRYTGKSRIPGQIPYNMEKDIDRLCLENALKHFLSSGKKEDAFDVYFCYLEMFVSSYKKTRRMIELLSEYEANGSRLLMSHRDHYSHSVYVFALGLAIYQTNSAYREKYKKFYELSDDKKAACHYLQFWGLASLFHDIGYPFELPYEQVVSYFMSNNSEEEESNNKEASSDKKAKKYKRDNIPYIAYHKLDDFLKISKNTAEKLKGVYKVSGREFNDTNELFAYALEQRLLPKGYNKINCEDYLPRLRETPEYPGKFKYFMDHAYFSASLLFKNLFDAADCEMEMAHIDALTAILLHNSLYKHYVRIKCDGKPLKADAHPIAFMLMLCDELQCWDRVAYGRNSKTELNPMDCEFIFEDGSITANYKFDEKEKNKIDNYVKEYNDLKSRGDEEGAKDLELKAYSKMYAKSNGKLKFESDIEEIVDLSEMKLKVVITLAPNVNSGSRGTFSGSNFIHLYDFATVLHDRYNRPAVWEKAINEKTVESIIHTEESKKFIEEGFNKLSLEYKLSNIHQAKAYAKHMDAIGCFYSDDEVDFEVVESFSYEELLRMGILEHQRWLQEHYDMGWTYGDPGNEERELVRLHKCMISGFDGTEVTYEDAGKNYERLDKEDQDKDKEPMKCMLAVLKTYDGILVYRLRGKK